MKSLILFLLAAAVVAGCSKPKLECAQANWSYLEVQQEARIQGYQQAYEEIGNKVQAIADKDAYKRGWEAGYSAAESKLGYTIFRGKNGETVEEIYNSHGQLVYREVHPPEAKP